MLDNLYGPDSTPSVQGEALAPAWNSVWVDPFPDPHSTPEENMGCENGVAVTQEVQRVVH